MFRDQKNSLEIDTLNPGKTENLEVSTVIEKTVSRRSPKGSSLASRSNSSSSSSSSSKSLKYSKVYLPTVSSKTHNSYKSYSQKASQSSSNSKSVKNSQTLNDQDFVEEEEEEEEDDVNFNLGFSVIQQNQTPIHEILNMMLGSKIEFKPKIDVPKVKQLILAVCLARSSKVN